MIHDIKKRVQTQLTSMFPIHCIEMIGKNNLLVADYVDWNWINPETNEPSRNVSDLTHRDVKSKISYGMDSEGRSFIAVRLHVFKSSR